MIAAIVLAGGKGQRVGRRNKGLLLLHNKPMISHVLEIVARQVGACFISANQSLQEYSQLGWPVVSDLPDLKELGPLAGIASVRQLMPKQFEKTLVVPCDVPFLPNDLVRRLDKNLSEERQISYAATQSAIHPSIFLYRSEIDAFLLDHIKKKQLSLRSWIFSHSHTEVLFEHEDYFTNVNSLSLLNSLNQQESNDARLL